MAKTGITNDAQLQAAIIVDMKNVVDYVVQKIWNDNRELIRQIIYEGYQPEVYERTGEFKEAWDTDVKTLHNYVQGEFKYDPRLLTVNEDNGQHSSLVDGTPMTEYLAEVIYEGLSGAIYEPGYAKNSGYFKGQAWTKKRDVWDALNDKLGKKTLRQYFEEGMRKQGIAYRRNRTGGVQVTIEK